LSLNLVTRDEEISMRVKTDVAAVFPSLFMHSSEDEVNEILVCMKRNLPSDTLSKVKAATKKLTKKDWLFDLGQAVQKLVHLRI
jgi:hypothetical protein